MTRAVRWRGAGASRLKFLVSRYGSNPNLDWEQQKQGMNLPIPDIVAPEQKKPLLSGNIIRKSLQQIAEANPPKPPSIQSTQAPAPTQLPPIVQYAGSDLEGIVRRWPLLRWLLLIFLLLRSF